MIKHEFILTRPFIDVGMVVLVDQRESIRGTQTTPNFYRSGMHLRCYAAHTERSNRRRAERPSLATALVIQMFLV